MTTDDTLHKSFISARKLMHRVISRIVPPREVEDIVQETYVRICQVEKKESIKQPRSFLLKTAKNLAFDHLKRSETRLVDSVNDLAEFDCFVSADDDVFQQVATDKEFSQYCQAIRELPIQCRKVFVLKKVYGYSQKEIANKLEISESTVEKHIALGVKRCTYFMMQLTKEERSENMKSAGKANQLGGLR
ncbi:MAG: RNA polymerase sigma factor [Colwellia sp.]|nr:RNA polymerase sigma factor [Colwellia sp.]MCW9081504.1 RNA polymerase sigma factor [Colwellia sp.]